MKKNHLCNTMLADLNLTLNPSPRERNFCSFLDKARKNLILLALTVLSLGIFSCETIVEDLPMNRFPEIKEKLVLSAFISPQDTMIYVKVSVSTPLFGEYKSGNVSFMITNGDTTFFGKSNVVRDAVVTLSTGSQQITVPFQSKNQVYALPAEKFRIEAGKTYTLRAVTKNNQAEATTTVPIEKVAIESYKADSTGRVLNSYSSNQGSQKDTASGYLVQFSWKDIAQKQNFYKVYGEFEYFIDSPIVINNVLTYRSQKASSNYMFYGDRALLDDSFQDGAIINSSKVEVLKQAYGSVFINGKVYKSRPSQLGSKLKLQVSNLSKELYDYERSLGKFNDADGNPFAEPAPVLSNVKNGLGCFAGYNRTEISIKLK